VYKRAIKRTIAGVLSVAAVLGIVATGRWAAAGLAARPPVTYQSMETETPFPSPSAATEQSAVQLEAAKATPLPARTAPPRQTTAPTQAAGGARGDMPQATESAPVNGGSAYNADDDAYIIGVQNGFIAVFIDDGEAIRLKAETEIPIHALPEEEQLRLIEGIRVDSAAALARLLEDYGS